MTITGGIAVLLIGIIAMVLGSVGLGGTATIPVQFMQALPYILTVVILAGFVGKAIPPRAGGEPYVKER
jgi:simple sugar transport system permease protein